MPETLEKLTVAQNDLEHRPCGNRPFVLPSVDVAADLVSRRVRISFFSSLSYRRNEFRESNTRGRSLNFSRDYRFPIRYLFPRRESLDTISVRGSYARPPTQVEVETADFRSSVRWVLIAKEISRSNRRSS